MQTAGGKVRGWLVLAIAIPLGLALMFLILPGALAEDPTPEPTTVPTEPPLGDCYGGVLSHAPLHCYALEQAEAAGVIDVDSIYLAGARLYVFVGGVVGEEVSAIALEVGNPTVGRAVYEGIEEEMKEYATLWPAWVDIDKSIWPFLCDAAEDSDAECLLKKLPVGVDAILDDIESYDSLYLRAGTGEDRIKVRGGAGWTLLWSAIQQDEAQRDERADSFEVSDVDTTNFPEINCSRVSAKESSCNYWARNVERGIHGVVGVYRQGDVLYVQLWRDPDDLTTFESEEATTLEAWEVTTSSPDWDGASTLEIIPVRYSYPKLWQWGVILDRFAKSQGNTIGIVSAGIYTNVAPGPANTAVGLYRDTDPLGDWSEGRGTDDYSLARITIAISTLDAYAVRDAIPVLLPQLGIPVDAVGIILQRKQKKEQIKPYVGTPSISDTGENVASDQTQVASETPTARETPTTTETPKAAEIPESALRTTDTPGDSSGPPQDSKVQSPNTADVAQPDSLTAEGQSAPSMDTPMPDAEDGSVLSPWVLTLISIGVVAMALVAALLAKIKLRRPDF